MIFPIGFSIPKCKIVDTVPAKTKVLATVIPNLPETYVFSNEEEYRKDQQISQFAITKKKGGWDCLRHYEILANGCIPLFEKLEDCPPNTMRLFPKDLVLESNRILPSKPNLYDVQSRQLLAQTRNHLTTEAMAKQVLETSGHTHAKRILFLSGLSAWGLYVDYLRCLTLHGFKELFGDQCHDYPKIPHLYKDFQGDTQTLQGKGFHVSKLLNSETRNSELDATIETDIANHAQDLIIQGSAHRGVPFVDKVMNVQKPQDVIFLCGEDMHTHAKIECPLKRFASWGHPCFIREL